VPSHQFLCSLLWFYGMELHHRPPSGVLHIVAFVTLCKSYMGIEPYFDLWNHFFRVRLQLDLSAKAAVLDGLDIYVKSGYRVDPYFHFPTSGSTDGWRKVWFFFRNDVDVPLPLFTGSHPGPSPIGGMEWPRGTSTGCNPCARSSNNYDGKG
jgi:hypothetical protein